MPHSMSVKCLCFDRPFLVLKNDFLFQNIYFSFRYFVRTPAKKDVKLSQSSLLEKQTF